VIKLTVIIRNVSRLLVGKPEGKRPLGRPRRRWMDNIKMDLLEIGLNVGDLIGLAQDRYSSCKLGNASSGSIKCWELPNRCTTFGLWNGTQLHKLSLLVYLHCAVSVIGPVSVGSTHK
jgi:hypothetical protein